MANTGVTTFSLLCVVHLYCVLGRQNKEIIFSTERSFELQNVIVKYGSNVTFSCPNRWDVRTNWYKRPSSGKASAFVNKGQDGCVLHNENYPSISLGPCNDDYSGITFNSIQYTDSGIWWCTIYVSNTLLTSQYVYVEVKENVETATSSSKQTVITGLPGLIGDSTTDEEDTSTSRSYLIPIVVGVCGVTVLIFVVVTIVIIKLRGRKYPQNGGGRQHNSRNDEEDEELVMSDNAIYMSYDQEEKTGDKSRTPAVSIYDKVPDVYSVVQKVRKSQADCSAQQKTEDQKSTETYDGINDIYSLEKKST